MSRVYCIFFWLCIAVSAVLAVGCSSTRHVPAGEYLLDKVKIDVEGDSKDISTLEMFNYLRQTPNHKVLGFWKLQLGTYNLSGSDTTKWYNRWVRRMGQPPVIYDPQLTEASARQLQLAMINRGYLGAEIKVDTIVNANKKKIEVDYTINTGTPHRISRIGYDIADSTVARLLMADSLLLTVHPGDKFDRDNLEAQRVLMARRLKEHGYYDFTKDNIVFVADTAETSKDVWLTLRVKAPKQRTDTARTAMTPQQIVPYKRYLIRSVTFFTDAASDSPKDTVYYRNISVVYGPDHYLKPSLLDEKCFIVPGSLYDTREIDRTYEALSRLSILHSVIIDLVPAGEVGDIGLLDARILLSRNKKQSVTFDVEGTNSEGDLGFGLGATYQHRNLARGSQLFTTRLRMNYESLSGSFNGLINDRYTEWAGEVGITFPRFEFPFASRSLQRRLNVSTEFAASFNYQERPEYTRIISGLAWKYKWQNRTNTRRHEFDLLDLNYVYLPERTNNFLDQIAPDNPLLRYSYEDHLIMSMSYHYYHSNKRIASTLNRKYTLQPIVYTIRASAETAGNILYLGELISGGHKRGGVYKVFDTQFSQYVKGEVDYAITRNFSQRQSMAFHVGGGIGVPYGNSTVLPFEKRFYAGGANGVRGWSVRTLGPGSYDSHNSVSYFINQCGDIRLDLSLEYRAKLFWVLEAGAFIDAGNIWTIRNYENQPGGVFKFNTFWKQVAWAYGLGLRMDFEYFLLRLDLGIKAYNPAQGQEHWPLIHPSWNRDTAFHFSVGYPF
ncbi:MAG: BamA/TamA family outer membrane protein [Muribaculaceae bacterium]|nr:BamA/TamA family outer membrane protein [Muribaculaceae bacterium]